MYKYHKSLPRIGDVVSWHFNDDGYIDQTFNITMGKLYVVQEVKDTYIKVIEDTGKLSRFIGSKDRKTYITKPGSEAKEGDDVICLENVDNITKINSIFTNIPEQINYNRCKFTYVSSWSSSSFKVLVKKEPQIKRNLAFYKRSGKSWTKEEMIKIREYCGCSSDSFLETNTSYKWVFEQGAPAEKFMHAWYTQEKYLNFKNCKQIAYEDIFNTNAESEKISYNNKNLVKTKETTMTTLQQILETIFETKLKTDYEARPKLLLLVYDAEGKEVAQGLAESTNEVEKAIKFNPKLWGCKIISYKLHKESTINVPVETVKSVK